MLSFFFKIVDVVPLDQLIENAKEMENVNANLIFEETNATNVKKVSMGIQSAKVWTFPFFDFSHKNKKVFQNVIVIHKAQSKTFVLGIMVNAYVAMGLTERNAKNVGKDFLPSLNVQVDFKCCFRAFYNYMLLNTDKNYFTNTNKCSVLYYDFTCLK